MVCREEERLKPRAPSIDAHAARAVGLRLDLCLVALLAVAMLGVAAAGVDLSRLHINLLSSRFNDQAGYVTMARSLAETGRLRPHILYTAALWLRPDIAQHHLYQPGHYVALALSFLVFGSKRAFAALLPNLVGYVVTALCAYLIARRLSASRAAGFVAAGLWLGFPPVLLFACSAMAELTLCAAAAVCLAVFVHLPERRRVTFGALLVCLPFLFRDLGAFLVAPLCALCLGRPGGEVRAAKLLGLTVLCTSLLFASPLCGPRITLVPGTLLDGSFAAIYNDASRQRLLAQAAPPRYLRACADNLKKNVDQLKKRLRAPDRSLRDEVKPQELVPLCALLGIGPLLCGVGFAVRRVRWLCLGAGVLCLLVVAFDLLAYDLLRHRGLRLLLFTVPLSAAALATALAPALDRAWGPRLGAVIVCAALCLCSQRWLRLDFAEAHKTDASDNRNTAFLDGLGHDPRTVLAGPSALALDWVVRRHPVDYAFIPANDYTLRLLRERHRVGTLILNDPPSVGKGLSRYALAEAGLHFVGRFYHDGQIYGIYQSGTSGPPRDSLTTAP